MYSVGVGKYSVTLTYSFIGRDLLVIITGGDEHIGGVSLKENNSFSSLRKIGHKDDIVSNIVASLIYDKMKRDTLVICGIHLNHASQKEIDILVNNAKICVEKFLTQIMQ
jgi:hypothetical protein